MEMQRLLLWLKEQGATFPAVKIEVGQWGREVRTSAPIQAGSLVLHIPKALFITVEAAKKSKIGRLITSSNCDIGDSGFMAAHLIEMKRLGGFWEPYIKVLPQSFPEYYYFLTESDLEYLKGSYVLPWIHKSRKQLDYEYAQLCSNLPKEKKFTRDEYAWGCCIYRTRAHDVTISGVKTHALIPLADMPNHSLNPNVRWATESSQGFLYSARLNIEVDDPLTIRYWRKGNTDTWARYAFCLENNPSNEAEIKLPSIQPDHPCFEYAKNFGVTRNGMRVFRVTRDHEASVSHALFSYLRLYSMSDLSDINLDKWRAENPQVDTLSHKNELAAMTVLKTACRNALQQFDTSNIDDETLLKEGALAFKLQNLIQVRHGEKAILNYFLNLAEASIFSAQARFI